MTSDPKFALIDAGMVRIKRCCVKFTRHSCLGNKNRSCVRQTAVSRNGGEEGGGKLGLTALLHRIVFARALPCASRRCKPRSSVRKEAEACEVLFHRPAEEGDRRRGESGSLLPLGGRPAVGFRSGQFFVQSSCRV